MNMPISALVVSVILCVPASATEQLIIHLRSGNGSPGSADALVTFAVGPDNGEFPPGSFTPALFSAAEDGPSAVVCSGLPGSYTPSLPSDPAARWISTDADPGNGFSAVYAISFMAPAHTIAATLDVRVALDNYLGWAADAGVWINGQPVNGSQLVGGTPIVTEYFDAEYALPQFDVSSMVHDGVNTLYLYCMDYTLAAAIIFSADVTLTVDPIGIWSSLGQELAGTAGNPRLVGSGDLGAGDPITLSLSTAKQFAPSWLVIGASSFGAPFKGGVMVPSVDFVFPLTTDFFGASSFGGLWPPGIPSGFSTYFQWWIQDSLGPKGFAASNAVSGTTP